MWPSGDYAGIHLVGLSLGHLCKEEHEKWNVCSPPRTWLHAVAHNGFGCALPLSVRCQHAVHIKLANSQCSGKMQSRVIVTVASHSVFLLLVTNAMKLFSRPVSTIDVVRK